jgi:methylmalonyl-CoA mutase C-terminal domain/subunit
MTSPGHSRLRIVVGEPGLALALRDAGHEVIYTGPDRSPEQIVATAIQEDADLIGLTEDALVSSVATLLEEREADDVAVRVYPPDQARAAR